MKKIAQTIIIAILVSITVPFAALAQNASPGGGGLTVSFPPQLQVITDTSAELRGQVSVNLAMPIDLSVVFGPKGSPLGNEQQLLSVPATVTPPSAGLEPGVIKPVTVIFSGLAKGQTYQFAIKNKTTNQLGEPLEFTTTGGTEKGGVITYTGGLFPYTPAPGTGTGSASGPTEFTDTISDKGIVPKCGRIQNEQGTVPASELRMCDANDFMQLIENVFLYGLTLLGIFVTCIAIYSGAMTIWLGRLHDPTAEQRAALTSSSGRLVRVVIGLVIIVFAWVLVATLFTTLGVKSQYSLLDIVSN